MESIRHQVDLQGYSGNVLSRILAVLNRSDKRLMIELTEKLGEIEPALFSMERLESLLTSVRTLSAATYQELGLELNKELQEFVAYEVSYQHQMLVIYTPVAVHVASVSAEQVYAAAVARPFQGVLLKGVWAELDRSKMKKVRETIAQGFVEGKTTDQIMRELRGTRAKGYADGIIERDRRDVEAVVRTAIGHTAGVAQDRVMEVNADLIKYTQLVAVLDSKTSTGCRLRDGLLYTPDEHKPVGHRVPWGAGPLRYHYRCRTGSTPVLKSFKELDIDLPEIVVEGKTRASMDGQVPATIQYKDWIKTQSAARQDEILGPMRAKLIRGGKIDLPEMYSPTGKAYTLDELRARDAEAFSRAGL